MYGEGGKERPNGTRVLGKGDSRFSWRGDMMLFNWGEIRGDMQRRMECNIRRRVIK